jgi:hypothetical protein
MLEAALLCALQELKIVSECMLKPLPVIPLMLFNKALNGPSVKLSFLRDSSIQPEWFSS